MIIFAYGSNMCLNRLRKRVPSAVVLTAGYLGGFAMKCHKKSIDGSGKGTLIRSFQDTTWGVLYEIDNEEKHQLDKAEGLNSGYNEAYFSIMTNDGPFQAQAYIADDAFIEPTARAYNWYKAFILQGALENHLPVDYISTLNTIPSIYDEDKGRRTLNHQILTQAISEPDASN